MLPKPIVCELGFCPNVAITSSGLNHPPRLDLQVFVDGVHGEGLGICEQSADAVDTPCRAQFSAGGRGTH